MLGLSSEATAGPRGCHSSITYVSISVQNLRESDCSNTNTNTTSAQTASKNGHRSPNTRAASSSADIFIKGMFHHFSNTFYTHNALDIANPSSMQDITNATAGILGRKGVQFWTTRTLNYTCHCQLFLQKMFQAYYIKNRTTNYNIGNNIGIAQEIRDKR